ncbi:hypothetical protein LGN19_38805 [Burkholderia sp. AU30198]|uniref:hypothetical protein n=1 Tax=Burkholderia sp. AU30198 TaxID=2879627 RepID=UPI001CF4C34B|nr:hypothetical protein [Burkholderia sp. AU30198]MCA8299741.1 hypothetical protein [Burkholderia sp. AU30198]
MMQTCAVDWKLVLEYMKVVLSWPVIVGIGSIIGSVCFREELRALINRISSFKILGQEVATQQSKLDSEAAEDEAMNPVPAGDVPLPALDGLQLTPAQRTQIRETFEAERAAARIWEYRYLNYFFAPSTQAVLDWLIGLGAGTTFDAYEAYWMNRIAYAGERQAVIHALQMHLCIQIDGPTITVTDKGREYQAWGERRILSMPAVPIPAR